MKKESAIIPENQDAYDDLIVSLESNKNTLNILICVCDRDSLKEQIINLYREELASNFNFYDIEINRENLNLLYYLNKLTKNNPELVTNQQAIISITGIEKLFKFSLNDEEKSELKTFIGYLQWTREALRQFPYSIVFWINNAVELQLQKNAPDFWSWRKGVFRFICKIKPYIYRDEFRDGLTILNEQKLLDFDTQESSLIPLQDLQALVKKLETNPQEKEKVKLANLYSSLGKIYLDRIETEGSENYSKELNLGIEYYQKTIILQQELNLEIELATSLNNLAGLYYWQGKYELVEPLYLQSLELRKTLLGEQHPHVASSLNNLALLYSSQGKDELAEPLFLQALELRKTLLGEQHPHVASSLNNLALLYSSQGKDELAEPLYLEALELRKTLLGEQHPDVASSLNNLAILYRSQGKDELAEPLFLQALELCKTLLGEQHPHVATFLNNLAELYRSQGKDELAEPSYLQALVILFSLLGQDHPHTKTVLNNFVVFLKQAIEDDRVSELSNHPLTQDTLKDIMNNDRSSKPN